MGCFDGAEICQIVGTFILSKLATIFDQENVGLYKDCGLGIFRNLSGPEIERRKKSVVQIFKSYGLNITITTNVTTVNYLDVVFDLPSNTFKPYRKPNDEPIYIHKSSNHPPAIIRQIPKSISNRISSISSNQSVFNSAIPMYKEALKNSGFDDEIKYIPSNLQNKKSQTKNRKRKIIWFNSPYSMNVKTSVRCF